MSEIDTVFQEIAVTNQEAFIMVRNWKRFVIHSWWSAEGMVVKGHGGD